MHVLLIEDDALVADGIRAGLETQGFVVDVAASRAEADSLMATLASDLVILDRGLPDGDGLGLLDEWRRAGRRVPVLVLTARDAVADRVAGLREGADDYLVKPFDLDELVARLQALLRRSAGQAGSRIEHGPLSLDPVSREVRLAGRPVSLSRRELMLLETFLHSPQGILSAERLKDGLYGLSEEVESNALNVHIHHLRRKLGPAIIETVRGLGYRLGAPEALVAEAST
ncbi:response regulator [Halomonas nitroreducens]|uniref:Response regulator n=1 Tax=Halomonas nitroreducens TaxID=447425 RepID=A0A431V916_9GAMM|nr:response regulator [Halomonas nitroreducens]RTR07175.1 response regulator [Halomonas nitroreducens]